MRLLLGRAAEADQLRRDLRAGAEGADADIAARQLLGHHAHGGLAEPEPPLLLGDGQAEHAKLRDSVHDLIRDELVLLVPAMGVGGDLFVGESAKLLADHVEGVVVQRPVAERTLFDKSGEAGARFAIAVAWEHGLDGGVAVAGVRRQAEIGEADDLQLIHRDSADDACQIFGKGELEDEALGLAEGIGAVQALAPALHLAQALDIGGEPGEAMNRTLLPLQKLRIEIAIRGDLRSNRLDRALKQPVDRFDRRPCLAQQILLTHRRLQLYRHFLSLA